jgi:5-methylcytosine-specific restriction protein A
VTSWRDMTDRLPDKAPTGARRSPQWPKTRNAFLKGKSCAVCGGRKKVIAHHVIPFWLAPDLENDPDNLLPLCEDYRYGINCHLFVGHLGNFRRANVYVRAVAKFLSALLKEEA